MKDTPAGTVITFRYRLPYWMTFFNLIAIPIAARLAYEIYGNIYANGGVSGITIGLAWIVVIPVTGQLFHLRRADKDLEALLGWCSRIIQADPPPLDME